ncbi:MULTISPECIES: O-antigen ligase family protein [unclassified Mesobacillus]|uniref:O-antigen ligase family protein n=1 Tax=unclassified Mesobacillus TaxID=2675270 RepID=UPI00203B4BE9|nr:MULTISPECIES: O-antigen ligase family protein [unclassified Mesobacillus]MCM3124158.1 O-antigen ligase family protein [Mesobacillus sp. MER 33]MCM3234007.1 O-antigen ligase family protein [Mesobacillus sp. MER 48]
MGLNIRNNNFRNTLVFFFLTLIFFNVFGLANIYPWREYGQITDKLTLLFSLLLFLYITFCKSTFNREVLDLELAFALFAGVYLFSHIYNKNFESNIALLILLSTFVFIITLMKIKWENVHLIVFGHISMVFVMWFFIHWIYSGTPMVRYMAIFNNSNVLAIFLFCLLYFKIVNLHFSNKWLKLYFFTGLLLNILLIYFSTSRTVLISVVIVFLSILVLSISKKIFSFLFYFVMSMNLVFVTLYLYFADSPYSSYLNMLSMQYVHKRFFTGREEIWGAVFEFGISSPLIGHRVGIQLKEYLKNSLYDHAHNQYLQILVESGFLGLTVFLIILYMIWKQYLKNLDSHLVKWSASFFIAILFYQNIELSLFIHFPSIGYLQWLIISIGVSSAIRDKSTKRLRL